MTKLSPLLKCKVDLTLSSNFEAHVISLLIPGKSKKAICLMEYNTMDYCHLFSKFELFYISNLLTYVLIHRMLNIVAICLKYAGLN